MHIYTCTYTYISEVALDFNIVSESINSYFNFHILIITTHLIAFLLHGFIFNYERRAIEHTGLLIYLFIYEENRRTETASRFMFNATVTAEDTKNNKIW